MRPLSPPAFPPDALPQLLVDHAPVGFACFDLELRYTYINKSLADINGFSVQEHLGRTVREIVPSLFEPVRRLADDILATGQPVLNKVLEGATLADPHVTRYWSESWYPLRNGHDIIGFGVIVQEVTERVLAERAAQAHERQLRALADALPQLVSITNDAGAPVYYNTQIRNYRGVHPQPDGTYDYREIVHPDDVAASSAHWQNAFASGSPFQFKHRLQMADGSYQWHITTGRRVQHHDGSARWYVTSTNIHEIVQSTESLRASERIYRAIGESIDYGIWICDPTGRNTYTSDSLLKLIGITREQCVDFGWTSVLHPDDAHDTFEAWKECVRTGSTWYREHRYLGADGQYHPILACGVPVRDDNGQITAWAGINLDISRLKQTEAALRAAKNDLELANAAKDVFLAKLSHELRTPLTPAVAVISALLRDPSLTHDLRQQLTIVHRNLSLEVHLINDLLDVTRIVHAKMPLQRRPINIPQLLASVLQIVAGEAASRGQKITLDNTCGSCWVNADPSRINQIFWNLLSNAIKFSPVDSRITIACASPHDLPGHVRVSVTDQGPGLQPADLERLFRPFEQGNTNHGGLGLGLAICKGLAELHGGNITAHSPGLGLGATFTVTLPCIPAPAAAVANAPSPCPSPAARAPRRILLVEDHADTARVLARLLQSDGHDVTHAATIQSALRLALSQPFDLILSDVSLPDGTGHQFLARLRAQGNPVPAIALSGHGADHDIQASHTAGFLEHLTKPIDFQDLLTAIHRTTLP